jgi:hypothetical protein
MRLHPIVLALLLVGLPSLVLGQGRDLREQYGTRSAHPAFRVA